jgi:hypothetical protein
MGFQEGEITYSTSHRVRAEGGPKTQACKHVPLHIRVDKYKLVGMLRPSGPQVLTNSTSQKTHFR